MRAPAAIHSKQVFIKPFLVMVKNNYCTSYVRNAIILIKQHIDNDPLQYRTCKDMLDNITSVDRRLLEKAFKIMYGCGIKQYQLTMQLELSKQYLQNGSPTKQVAKKCHYSSQSAYSKAFKKEFGTSPTEWLKQDSAHSVPSSRNR
jgi:AraC-like DNA-binding protein